MGRFNRHSWGAMAALGLVVSGGATAQVQVQPERETGRVQSDQPLVSVRFPGGTVAEYVEMLRAAIRPRPANIALSEAAGRTAVPPIDLDAVTLGTALEALGYIISPAMGPAQSTWGVQMLSQDPPAYAVALYPLNRLGAEPNGDGPDRTLQVFSIKELIDPPAPGGPTPETVLSAVDLALRMAGTSEEQPPALKFHPDSGLLVLDAPPQQVAAIESLLERMRNDVFRQRNQARETTDRRLEFETALRVAEVKSQSAAARNQFAQQALDQVQGLRQTGAASPEDLRRAQMEFMDSKGQMDMAEVELKAARERLDGLGAQPGTGGGAGEAEALRAEVQGLRRQVAMLEAKIRELEGRRK